MLVPTFTSRKSVNIISLISIKSVDFRLLLYLDFTHLSSLSGCNVYLCKTLTISTQFKDNGKDTIERLSLEIPCLLKVLNSKASDFL